MASRPDPPWDNSQGGDVQALAAHDGFTSFWRSSRQPSSRVKLPSQNSRYRSSHFAAVSSGNRWRMAGAGVSPRRPEGGVEECHSFGWCLVFKGKHHAEGKIMRIFVTGATGALGRHLVPGLVAAGHEVTATTRTPGKVAQLREAGAEPVVVDGLDREAVIAAVRVAAPEVILHQMTALADMRSLRKPDQLFAVTNELRTQGTDNLLTAAARAGTRRVIAQSYVGANERSGGPVKTEEDPLDSRPVPSAARTLAAIKHVEKTVPLEAPEGIVLRYGSFYGPGASEILLEAVRKRQLPVIGGGTGIWSFIEITDAAAATLAAVDRGSPGVYNVVDSAPAPVAEWLPYLAKVAGAKPPLRVPAWLGRLLAGEFVVAQMTSARGSSNEKARKELGWEPRYPSWREGFRAWVSG
jgi:nucleoside-diphosphate-sugar epimerase